jgi:hypothetical protein
MGLLNPNWLGITKTVARGPNSTEPTDPQYGRSFDVVPGSLDGPTDALVIGSYEPAPGSARARVPANLRLSGDTVFIDRAVLPEPAVGALKPAAWAAEHRSIAPTSFSRDELVITTNERGLRSAVIPDAYGGGTIHERPGAVRGRINDASPAEQLRALRGWFSRPRG